MTDRILEKSINGTKKYKHNFDFFSTKTLAVGKSEKMNNKREFIF